jgi:parallel beta-helix repeat protein
MKKILLLLLLITTASYSQTLLKLKAIEYAPGAGYCTITNSLGVQTYTPCSSLSSTVVPSWDATLNVDNTTFGSPIISDGTLTLIQGVGNKNVDLRYDYIKLQDNPSAPLFEANLTTNSVTVNGNQVATTNQLPVLTASTNITISGTTPNYTISATGGGGSVVSTNSLITVSGSSITANMPFVTPEMYGAVGDGVTNDQAALQSAINSGSMVILGEKNYRITSELSVTSNVTIIGSGKLSIISATTNIVLIRITGDYNTFKNFTFKGTSSTGGAGATHFGLWVDGNVGLTLTRINNIVEGCYFINLYWGVAVRNMVGSSSATKHEGAFKLSNCVFTGNLVGFYALSRGEYNTLSNCDFYGNTTGVYFIGGNNNLIGGQVVDNTTGFLVANGTNDGHSAAVGVKFNHNTTNLQCTNSLGYTFSACQFFAGSILLTGTGKNKFLGCEFSMSTYSLTITNSPASFFNSEFTVVPTTYSLTGTAPIVSNCYSLTTKMATPKISYNELTTLAANGTFTVPAGMSIESIIYENTTANAVTGGVRFGTTNGGAQVVTAQAIGANGVGEITDANILLRFFSSTAQQILYIQAVTAWNSASVKFYIKLKPLI